MNWREARDDRETFRRARADNVWVSASSADATSRLFRRGDAVSLWRALCRCRSLDATPPRMDVAAPLRLPGSRVQVAVASSLPILTVREAPPPPTWALTSTEDQIMARQNKPIKRSVAKIAGGPSKKLKRQVRQERGGTRYIASAQPNSYESIGRVW